MGEELGKIRVELDVATSSFGGGFIQRIEVMYTHSEGFCSEVKAQGRHTNGTNRHG